MHIQQNEPWLILKKQLAKWYCDNPDWFYVDDLENIDITFTLKGGIVKRLNYWAYGKEEECVKYLGFPPELFASTLRYFSECFLSEGKSELSAAFKDCAYLFEIYNKELEVRDE